MVRTDGEIDTLFYVDMMRAVVVLKVDCIITKQRQSRHGTSECHPHRVKSSGAKNVSIIKHIRCLAIRKAGAKDCVMVLIIHFRYALNQMTIVVMEKKEKMSKAAYRKGKRIESISEFDQCESLWYKWNGKTTHRSVLISLQYRTLLNAIINGRVYVAERITDE